MYMDDYVKQLDMVLSSGNRELLTSAGSVSHKQAIYKAKSEYRKYQKFTGSKILLSTDNCVIVGGSNHPF